MKKYVCVIDIELIIYNSHLIGAGHQGSFDDNV